VCVCACAHLHSCVKVFDPLELFQWDVNILALYILEVQLPFISSAVGLCFVNIFSHVCKFTKSDY